MWLWHTHVGILCVRTWVALEFPHLGAWHSLSNPKVSNNNKNWDLLLPEGEPILTYITVIKLTNIVTPSQIVNRISRFAIQYYN